MKKSVWIKISALVMSIVLLITSMPLIFAGAEESTIDIGVFSDIHYFANSIKGDKCEGFKEFNYYKSKEYTENDALLSNALQGVETVLSEAEENNAKFLLIPGDLTKDGEFESHIELAGILEAWQERTGIPVFITNGNHDVNNPDVVNFANGKKEEGTRTSPEQFREIYKNLGFDKADAFFTPAGYPEAKGGMLSYTADLGDIFRLIVVDSNMYSEDNGAENNLKLTDGRVGDELLGWVKEQAEAAKKSGKTPIIMQHHNIVPHMDIEEATFFAFVINDWERVCDSYADFGIHYVFSGHLHSSDTSSYVNDNGERITDILSPTLTGYPNYFRKVTLTSDGKTTSLDMVNYDIDDESLGLPQITDDFGNVYERPYKFTASYGKTFGNTINEFLERIFEGLINDYFEQIKEAGGLIPFLKTMGIDLEQILTDLIGTGGLSIGNLDILTIRTNVMGLINDIDRQIMDKFITKPDETLDTLMGIVNKLLEFEVSEYPCTYNYEMLGTTPTGKGCTLGEYATTALLLYYGGDEELYGKQGYEYIKDTLDRFENGDSAERLFNLLVDVVLQDVAKGVVLENIDLNPGQLFPEGSLFGIFGKILDAVFSKIFGGDVSLLNIVESVLSIKLVPEEYSSIEAILDTLLLDRYLTPSQYESWGATISWMVKTLVFDINPDEKMDNNISMTYSGKEDVEVSKDNYRLPNLLVMNLTEDETTSATITWYTKYSITDSDIEIIDYSANPVFTGKATKSDNIKSETEIIRRGYPGADLGVFAFLLYTKEYAKHTVTVNGLKPGAKYSYRVGCAERGWWSDAGTITMSAGNDEAFTFINITDPQAQKPEHYRTYGNVMNAAVSLYPDARFTVSNGDQVDYGQNIKHWNYFLNSSDTFLNIPFMPTTGNHENKGEILKTAFTLPGVPEQDETTGTYYSYDYNNVHFTVLNTNDMPDKKLSDEQINWMKADISSSDAKWRIVVLHKALYCDGIYYKDKETKNLRDQLCALLPYLGVDLVLSGHNHVYSRTDVMNTNCVVPTATKTVEYNGQSYEMKLDPKGTVYSIIGSAGIKEYKEASVEDIKGYFPEPEKIVENDYPMFAAITVDGDNLYYSAYQIKDGKTVLADSFGIAKPADSKSPSEKTGALSNIIGAALSKISIGNLWKLPNLILSLIAPLIKFIQTTF